MTICPVCGSGPEKVGQHIDCAVKLRGPVVITHEPSGPCPTCGVDTYEHDVHVCARVELAALRAQVQQERRLRQSADSALAQALRHPNSKLDNVAGYLFRLEQAVAREDSES